MWIIEKNPNLVNIGDRVRSKRMFHTGYIEGIVDYITVDVRCDHTRTNVIHESIPSIFNTVCYDIFGDRTRNVEVWRE